MPKKVFENPYRQNPARSNRICLRFSGVSQTGFKGRKICLTYFELCQTYFKLSQRYFLLAPM